LFQCKDDDHDPEGPPGNESNAKSVTAFAFQALTPVATGTINEAAKTITLTVPYGTNVTALVPTIAISAEATIAPASGAAQNFTNPVQYTVTAEDDSQQTYTVTVTVGERPIETCRATVLPGIQGTTHMILTYGGEGNTLQQVDYVDSLRTGDKLIYTCYYEYTDNKLTRIEYTNGGSYYEVGEFEYTEENVITEIRDGIPMYYYLEDGRIRYYKHDYNGTRITVGEFIYDEQGNVVRMNTYLSDGSLEGYELYEYDNTPNVYAKTGAAGYPFLFFSNINLSQNNVTKIASYYFGEEDVSPLMEHTYDAYGRPFQRRAHYFDYTITFEYECP
jgi:hypothetical protein